MSNSVQITGIKELKIKYSNRKSNIRNVIRDWMRNDVKPMIFEAIEGNFHAESEGNVPWVALKADTIEDRLRKGFPGSRPKLRRTGELLLEALGKRGNQSGIYSEKIGEAKLSFGLETKKAFSHVEGKGRPGQDLPKRNFMYVSMAQRRDVRTTLHLVLAKFMLKT